MLTPSSIEKFTLDADKLSPVAMPGGTLQGPDGGPNACTIESPDNDYLWIEGSIDAAADDMGVRLEGVD